MSWSDDVSELTNVIMTKYSVPAAYEEAVRAAVLKGMQRCTENWCKKSR